MSPRRLALPTTPTRPDTSRHVPTLVLSLLGLLLLLAPAIAQTGPAVPSVQISAPACTADTVLAVSGTVTADEAVDRVAASIDGGAEQELCLGCGFDPAFAFDATLAACDNTIRVTAEDAGGDLGEATATVRLDGDRPVFTCPESGFYNSGNVNINGRAEIFFDTPTVVDACDGSLTPDCRRWDEDFVSAGEENLYREGTSGWTCTRSDSCNNRGFCSWAVTVLPPGAAFPAEGCQFFEFRDLELLDYPTFGVSRATVGTVYDWENISYADGAHANSYNAPLEPTADHGLFLYRNKEGNFRVETPLPRKRYNGGDETAVGGPMLRWGFDEQAPRAWVMYLPNDPSGPMIEFRVRTDYGLVDEPMALRISAADVTDLALELEGNRVTAQYSTDGGHTWTTPTGAMGGAATVAAVGDAQVGLFTSNYYLVYPYLQHCPIQGVDPGPNDPGPNDPGPGDPPTPEGDCQDDDFEDNAVAADWTLTGLGHGNQLMVEESNGQLELTGAGATAFISADNGAFLYKAMSGDFRMEVTVDATAMSTGGAFRKAGLMVRSGLDPWAPRLIAQLVPYWNNSATESHLQFVARETQNGSGNVTVADDVVGTTQVVRLAIERLGDDFTAQYSLDGGTTWTTPTGGLNGVANLALPETVLVGLDVVSNDVSIPSTVVFDDFVLCPLCRVDDFEDSVLDPAWTLDGLGNANQVAGDESGGVFALTADGATAFTGADNAGFLYRQVTGDFRAEVTVDGNGMTTGGAFRKTGLMVRSSLDPWAPRLLAQLVPYWNNSAFETHLQFVAREVLNGPGNVTVATDVVGVPRVVRLAIERQGNVFSVEYSTDGGATWTTPTGGSGGSITLSMPATLLLGLDMVSNDISITSTSEFDDFALCGGTP